MEERLWENEALGMENRVSGKKTTNRSWVRRVEDGGDAFGEEL